MNIDVFVINSND